MKILHAIVKDENVNTIRPIGGGCFESGEWDVSERTARSLVISSGIIMLHPGQKKPSRHGGVIQGFSTRTTDGRELYSFVYMFDPSCMGVTYEGGWSQQIAIEET